MVTHSGLEFCNGLLYGCDHILLLLQMYEKAVVLYAELAEAALTGFLMSKEPQVMEAVRLHSGTEENWEALRKSRGEDDEDFQITEYQAQRGNAPAMYKLGLLYYYGLRGLRSFH
jgi:SEL1 protein